MWEVELAKKAIKQFSRLPRNIQKDITKAIEEKLSVNPGFHLSRLSGDKGNFYRFRVKDYRLLCLKQDKKIIVIAMGHRKSIYKTEY